MRLGLGCVKAPSSCNFCITIYCITIYRSMPELIWDGKCKDSKKQGPVRIALPFQIIETVNVSAPSRSSR